MTLETLTTTKDLGALGVLPQQIQRAFGDVTFDGMSIDDAVRAFESANAVTLPVTAEGREVGTLATQNYGDDILQVYKGTTPHSQREISVGVAVRNGMLFTIYGIAEMPKSLGEIKLQQFGEDNPNGRYALGTRLGRMALNLY